MRIHVEVSVHIKRKKKKKIHPVFEKLEFYLNLKNNFALTFIQDEHRVFISSQEEKKIPPGC